MDSVILNAVKKRVRLKAMLALGLSENLAKSQREILRVTQDDKNAVILLAKLK